jgi:hypothetical protein
VPAAAPRPATKAQTAAMKLLYRPQSLMPVLPNWSTL